MTPLLTERDLTDARKYIRGYDDLHDFSYTGIALAEFVYTLFS